MRKVNVPLGDRAYRIDVGPGVLGDIGGQCRRLKLGKRCAVITDTKVGPLFARRVKSLFTDAGFSPIVVTIPSGETGKSLDVVKKCYDALAKHRIERSSFVVALGGGVVGDLAGFVAASYLRGIPFIQVPTTLLSQVDSSVGGKVGVNLKAGKNLVGAFHQPRHVFCDLESLKSLPEREYRSGLAEVIKYGIIHDARLFAELERKMPELLAKDSKTLGRIIARSCAIKAEVVGQDEKESGLRAILNFGHTIGHAIEAISGYGRYLHGEAISIGQVAAAEISAELLGFSSESVDRIRNVFVAAGLPVRIRLTKPQRKKLFAAMQLDKKVSAGEVKFVLAERIGSVKFGIKVPDSLINSVLDNCTD